MCSLNKDTFVIIFVETNFVKLRISVEDRGLFHMTIWLICFVPTDKST